MTPDLCPTEAIYTINIYSQDRSRMPKAAFYKTGIDDSIQNKTRALILATDQSLFDPNERERFSVQLNRAEGILYSKMDPDGIIPIKTRNGFEEYMDTNIHPMAPGQTLFIYLFGKTELRENKPCFLLNNNDTLYPEDLFLRLPRDPNQRVLILMDTLYSRQFLSSPHNSPQTWHKNWAGIASTNQGDIFFPVYGGYYYGGGYHTRQFPCFSNLFFSMVYSGATVAQAYRTSKNAVSLTLQHPGLFLEKEAQSEYDINRYLNYNLGTSAIHGEDYALFNPLQRKGQRRTIKSFISRPSPH